MKQHHYVKSNNTLAYEKALIADLAKYSDPNVLGQGNEARVKIVSTEIIARYKALSDKEIAEAKGANAEKRQRSRAIGIAKNYLNYAATADEKERVRADIGRSTH